MTSSHTSEQSLKLVITTARGLESFLKQELDLLGYSYEQTNTGVFELVRDKDQAYHLCLWSRIAQRVLWELVNFDATTIDTLYQKLCHFPWRRHLNEQQTFRVEVNTSTQVTDNTQFLALKVKDAIVDSFTQKGLARPNVNTNKPDLNIHVFWDGQHVRCYLDLSGEPLHKRGYRRQAGEAPIRETLAAAMLYAVNWHQQTHGQLIDPFCGSGTLLIEAAMMSFQIAPGLLRQRFGFERWLQHNDTQWQTIRKHAINQRTDNDTTVQNAFIFKGYDADTAVLKIAQQNSLFATLEKHIHFERRSMAQFNTRAINHQQTNGFIVTNPPYGERLGHADIMKLFYRTIGQKLKKTTPHWHVSIISDHIEKVDALGLIVDQTYKVFNGPIACFLRIGTVKPAEIERPVYLPNIVEAFNHDDPIIAKDLINRLIKNFKARQKWLATQTTDCFRLYDADMPEYNIAIDWYQGHWHIQEYAPPKSVDPNKAQQRLTIAINSLRILFHTPEKRIHLKTRQKQKGKSQYNKNTASEKSLWLTVNEHNIQAQVNLTDYLDTGLFLDHRPTRFALQKLCINKRFLNLFCYTGVATLHAALGNEQGCAKSSISVDTSNTYLDWAQRNLAINGLSESDHRLIRHDCIEWLRKTREQFDVIFLDPPTFSNSKSRQHNFDIQRDHSELIELAMKRLEHDGLLIFSTNAKKFKLDDNVNEQWLCSDMTKHSIPVDFKRQPPIHQCWYIKYRH